MNNITIRNIEPQNISINGGGTVIGITKVYVNGRDVTDGSVAYVVVPTKTSELQNDSGFITTETDPTVPYYVKQISLSDISRWNSKQNQLISGSNIKTINNNSILGSGNLEIEGNTYTAGNGISISNSNVITNLITSYNSLSDKPNIPTKTSDLINDSDFTTRSEFAQVAFSGSYLDLTDEPVIPQNTSDLYNDSGFITNSTNQLENYMLKSYLDTILPKTTGSGTSINLTDSAGTPLSLSLDPSALSQDGTPTPDSPQDIHTISGSNSIVVEGKNLYNPNTQEQGGFNYRTGENYAHSSSIRNIIYNIEPNTQYTISCNQSIGEAAVCFFDSNGTSLIGTATSSSSVVDKYWSFTTKANTSYIKIRIGSNAYPKTTSGTYDIQLEKGSTATTYEPYQSNTQTIDLTPYNLGSIGNYENKFIRVEISDNLFDKNNIIENKRLNGSGVAQTDNGYYVSSFIKVEPNTKYIKNSPNVDAYHRFSYYSSNNEISFISNADSNTATTPSNCQYLRFCGLLTEINTTQLNKGETLLPYTPYEKGWYYKQGIGKATLNGGSSENWIKGSTSNNYSYFYTSTYDNLIGNNYDGMCNVFNILKSIMTASTSVTTDTISIGGSEYSKIRVKILTSRLSKDTTNAYLTWLSTNLPLVYYQMATPTYTKLTDTTLINQLENIYKNMLSYKGTTNISQVNNDLPFVISASTFKIIGG